MQSTKMKTVRNGLQEINLFVSKCPPKTIQSSDCKSSAINYMHRKILQQSYCNHCNKNAILEIQLTKLTLASLTQKCIASSFTLPHKNWFTPFNQKRKRNKRRKETNEPFPQKQRIQQVQSLTQYLSYLCHETSIYMILSRKFKFDTTKQREF